jgi:hypothetical protein
MGGTGFDSSAQFKGTCKRDNALLGAEYHSFHVHRQALINSFFGCMDAYLLWLNILAITTVLLLYRHIWMDDVRVRINSDSFV